MTGKNYLAYPKSRDFLTFLYCFLCMSFVCSCVCADSTWAGEEMSAFVIGYVRISLEKGFHFVYEAGFEWEFSESCAKFTPLRANYLVSPRLLALSCMHVQQMQI